MKKIACAILVLATLIFNLGFETYAAPSAPAISSDNAVLIDAKTGEVLYYKNMNAIFPPASTTKLMTALLTIENCNLEDTITVSNDFLTKNSKYIDGNRIYIENGEQLKIKDLLYSLLLMSANDSAVALADHISGSVPEFTKLMNKKAKELGCTSTNFENPNGLYDDKHKSSVKDLALIMQELLKHPEFTKVSTTLVYEMSPTNKFNADNTKKTRRFWNEDKLLYKQSSCYYEGILGSKSGYTIQSFHSFSAAATRNNSTFIVAFHGKTKTFYEDTKILLDYAFNNFEEKKLFSKGDIVTYYNLNGTKIPLIASSDYYYVAQKGSKSKPEYSIKKGSIKKTSFNKGDMLLTLKLKLDNKDLSDLKLISGTNYKLRTIGTYKISNTSQYIILVIFCFILLLGCLFIFFKAKSKKSNKNIYY
ncbi:D-alanyl-D-alanine carboxypeptidase family protein [Clostridium guangxiense]|uniref:D-alanyl-D-alanine carboxypeptidase family protein n=1 Tax=Clostridium guangxiense TaxID=1662055 RepID=UPI001E37BE57|nr:D-alanyl-D-alanine carboxypeptidase family protein [Clostridium guangxiense]MCD2347541.1 D-alanyl-D-alanine carboxypeptidase [Clostridium guangxiense]